VVKAAVLSPADALMSGRMVKAAEGMEWTAARQEAQELTLEGKRGAERHILTFVTDGKPRLREWTLTRPRSAPDGTSFEQRYRCQATSSPEGLASIEEWVFSLAPVNTVTYRLTEVKKTEALPGVRPEEIRLRFPRGTTVTDTRFGAPVEYELTEEGLPEERVESTVRNLAANKVLPGQPVPDLTFTDLKGKPFRLADQKGKVVLLFWFSSGSRLAADVAAMVQQLHQDYRRRGVQVVGLDVAEEGDPAKKAEAFGKKYKWSFPVVVDAGEALRRIGYELAVPKVAIMDGTGKLVYAEPGFDVDAVTAQLDRLTKQAE
jgi:peroxiredoxin